jgi:uncharacterized membrane protein
MRWTIPKIIVLAFVVMNMLIMNLSSVVYDNNSTNELTGVENVVEDSDIVDFIDEKITRSSSRTASEGDQRGGSWLDSFQDGSGIDSSGSANYEVTGGSARIRNSDLEEFTTDSDTVALWHMNEASGTTLGDSSSNALTGTFKETPEWTSGWFGGALEFQGGDQFYDGDAVVVPHDPVLNLGSSFTIEAWIKVKGNQEYNAIVDKYEYNATAVLEFGYTFQLADGFLRTSIYSGGAGKFNIVGTSDLRDDKWHHVAVVYDGTYYYQFVDGHQEIKLPSTLTPSTTINDLGIGLRLSGFGGFMPLNGLIDEMRISSAARFPTDLYASLRSESIQIPAGMGWDTVIFNSTIPADSDMTFKVLDSTTGFQVPGTPTFLTSTEYDISFIDSSLYPSIKLKVDLEGNNWGVTPLIHYWGVSWNASFVLRDSFFGGDKLEDIIGNNIEVVDGSVVFSGIRTITTKPIDLPDENGFKFYFDSLALNRDSGAESNMLVTVTDTKNKPILDFKDLTVDTVDLSVIDPEVYPSIKLRFNYISSTTHGALHDWSINLIKNHAPVFQDVYTSSAIVYRTQSVRITANLIDADEPAGDLSIIALYNTPSNDTWRDDYLGEPVYPGDSWEYDFTPPADAETGSYTFMFECTDNLGDSDTVTRSDFIEVLNNMPVITEIETSTSEFSLYRTQNLEITFKAADVETPLEDLKVRIFNMAPEDNLWRADYFSEFTETGGLFSTLFSPPADASSGMYMINLSCDDGTDIVIETFQLEVLNNLPSEPFVEIRPAEPRSTEDLTVTAFNSTDIETPVNELIYWYRWYRDDKLLNEFDNLTSISGTDTSAGERWRCQVFAFDGEGLSAPGEVEVLIEAKLVTDQDGDGVPDDLDAFPGDPAASVDSDGDGYPDHWNLDKSKSDSVTGLSIDDYPDDSSRHTKSKDKSEPQGVRTDSIFWILIGIVIIILMFAVIVSIVHRSKRQREGITGTALDDASKEELDESDRLLLSLKHEILSGKKYSRSELSNTRAKKLLRTRYKSGEITDEAYDYIKGMIGDTEEAYHYQMEETDIEQKE